MKKFILSILVGILGFLGFSIGVKADNPPETFVSREVIMQAQYVPGLTSYLKPLDGGVYAYCLEKGLTYVYGLTYRLSGEVDDGFVYIIENAPNTGSQDKDYYIQSIATWWYKDIIEGNDNNIPLYLKNYIIENYDNDSVCKAIYDLVQGAKNFRNVTGSISFSPSNVSFTLKDDYYLSNTITVKTVGSKFNEIKLENAPVNASIISNVDNTGNGTFQIKVPKDSINPGSTANFKVTASGEYAIKKAYDYTFDTYYQNVIYGKVYTTYHNMSNNLSLKITRNQNSLKISKVTENNKLLSGAELTLYKGDCTNQTCTDVYSVWETTTSVKVFNNIPIGKYTLVETKTPYGYQTADKMLINIDSDNKTYTYKMVDKESINVRISKTDITGEKEIPGASLELKDENDTVIASWISTNEPHYELLNPGIYVLTETIAPKGYILNKSSVNFKIDLDGKIYEKKLTGEYVLVEYIKMINIVKPMININKLDSETNEYLEGAELAIKDNKGEIIADWITTNEAYYISLDEGEYTLVEINSPKGYILNNEPINFKVNSDGDLFIKDETGNYISANGIIMYNNPEVIEVPSTGLSSKIVYIIGFIVTASGAIMLFKNEKQI